MIDPIVAAIEALLIGLSMLHPENKEQYFLAFSALGLVWIVISLYRFLNRHEVLDAIVWRFMASTEGPHAAFLAVVNVSPKRKGAMQITVINDSGQTLGSCSTRQLDAYCTLQLSAAELEGATPSTKLPNGGANIAAKDRRGHYIFHVRANFEAHVQAFYFDGEDIVFPGTITYRKKSHW